MEIKFKKVIYFDESQIIYSYQYPPKKPKIRKMTYGLLSGHEARDLFLLKNIKKIFKKILSKNKIKL